MNQVPEEKKDSVTKTLAILGFVAIIILIVWLAVKVVGLLPGAFSALASIADSVYNRNGATELVVSTQNSVVNAGEAFTISWEEMRGTGNYTFSHECAEGVSVDIRRGSSDIVNVPCSTVVDLEDETEIDVVVNAEKQRFTDVEYIVSYEQDGVESIAANKVITIVNATIPTGVTVTEEETEEETEPVVVTVAPEPEVTDTYTAPVDTTPTTPVVAGPPEVVEEFTYELPVSDPYGFVDLQVIHLGVGVAEYGVFTPQEYLYEDQHGAMQFEIKNIGTKTAYGWSYEVELPGGGDYDSGEQYELQPNERVVVTLGFGGVDDDGQEHFGVEVDAEEDIDYGNNDYSWYVEVID